MLYFTDFNCYLNGTGFLVNSAGLSVDTKEAQVKSIGYVSPSGAYRLNTPNTNLQINYPPKLSLEPFINYLSNFTGAVSNYGMDGFLVNIGGLNGNYWVNDYNIAFNINSQATAVVSLTSYLPISGSISADSTSVDYLTSTSELADSWSVGFEGNLTPQNVNVLSFSYSYRLTPEISYRIGSISPADIRLQSYSESCVISCEYLNAISTDRVYLESVIGKPTLGIYQGGINGNDETNKKTINLSSFSLKQFTIDVNTSDRVIASMTFGKEI